MYNAHAFIANGWPFPMQQISRVKRIRGMARFRENVVLSLFTLVWRNCMYSQKTWAGIESGSLVAGDETTRTTGSATPPLLTVEDGNKISLKRSLFLGDYNNDSGYTACSPSLINTVAMVITALCTALCTLPACMFTDTISTPLCQLRFFCSLFPLSTPSLASATRSRALCSWVLGLESN